MCHKQRATLHWYILAQLRVKAKAMPFFFCKLAGSPEVALLIYRKSGHY